MLDEYRSFLRTKLVGGAVRHNEANISLQVEKRGPVCLQAVERAAPMGGGDFVRCDGRLLLLDKNLISVPDS